MSERGYKMDILVNVHVRMEADIFVVSREDVLTRLMLYAAAAAAIFGPYSDEVEALENDIEDVKDGADLADFLWVFPEQNEGEETK